MKIAIVGSRTFEDYHKLLKILTPFKDDVEEIISGGARGADTLAEKFADCWRIKLTVFEADWEHLGRKAGFVRNKDIVENCDMLFAFWDGHSKGTASSISIAREMKKNTVITYF